MTGWKRGGKGEALATGVLSSRIFACACVKSCSNLPVPCRIVAFCCFVAAPCAARDQSEWEGNKKQSKRMTDNASLIPFVRKPIMFIYFSLALRMSDFYCCPLCLHWNHLRFDSRAPFDHLFGSSLQESETRRQSGRRVNSSVRNQSEKRRKGWDGAVYQRAANQGGPPEGILLL